MKITFPKAALQAAFSDVEPVVPSRTPAEIRKNVHLSVTGTDAVLTANEGEIAIQRTVECEPQAGHADNDAVLLPTKRFGSILREAVGDAVTLKMDNGKLTVTCGSGQWKLSTENADDFPAFASLAKSVELTVRGEQLKRGIARTVFACDVESTRYAMSGVLVDVEHGAIVATDSRRLSLAPLTFEGTEEYESTGQVIVPSRAMQTAARTIEGGDSPAYLAINNSEVMFRSGRVKLHARRVEGRFPKYQDVIPQQSNGIATCVCGPLGSLVRQAMIVTDKESRGVDFLFSNGTLTLSSQAADIGASNIKAPIQYDGAETLVTFDPRFIHDFVKALPGEEQITFGINGGSGVAVLRSGDSWTYVVMPLAR